MQQKDAGSWLWISMDDTVLNAVKKARHHVKHALMHPYRSVSTPERLLQACAGADDEGARRLTAGV